MKQVYHDPYEKLLSNYKKMVKVGVPRETVLAAMQRRNIDPTMIRDILGNVYPNSSSSSVSSISVNSVPAQDSIVQAVIQKFQQRSSVGIDKYGTTLDRSDLNPSEWIQHAQEELMDGILYLEKLKGYFR
jgi:hypothetical protein